MAEKILIVDDEADIREILVCNLEVAGYEVVEASSAEEALEMLDDTFSLILLDIMMEGMNGYRMAEVVRKERMSDIPIIFLTAKDQENDLLTGFARGGDDYITKPFSLQEVLARIKAVLRRRKADEQTDAKAADGDIINIGGITVDCNRKIVIAQGEELKLSPKEFGILVTLCTHPGRVFSREEILDAVWHGESFVLSRTIDVHITRIRKKLGKDGDHITNRQGYGYSFEA